jgi:hypothetical protein
MTHNPETAALVSNLDTRWQAKEMQAGLIRLARTVGHRLRFKPFTKRQMVLGTLSIVGLATYALCAYINLSSVPS